MARLKPLPYSYDFLAPTISRKTVTLHHDKHQAAYVKGWNDSERRLSSNRGQASGADLRDSYEDMAFNGAGIVLHELYWANLTATGTSLPPSHELLVCSARCFGSIENMVNEIAEVGATIQGSGWVVLCWVPRFERMVIAPIRNHEDGWIPGAVPLLVIDVWEHAYYLDYQNARREYLRLLWANVDWAVVSRRYQEATK